MPDAVMWESLGTGAPGTTSVAMASADTQYSWAAPEGVRGVSLRLQDTTVAWRWSNSASVVALTLGTMGFPMLAGESIVERGPVAGTAIYYFASSVAGQTMQVAYLGRIGRS